MNFLEVEGNLRNSFRGLACCRKCGEIREISGLEIISLGVSFQMFNAAFLSGPVATQQELEQRFALAKVFFDARRLPWSFWLCEDWLDPSLRRKVENAARRYDLRQAAELPGMGAAELRRARHPLPEVELRLARDGKTLEDFIDVGARCFRVPHAWFAEVFDDHTPDRSSFQSFVAYYDGQAVSTTAAVVSEGIVGVYNVATLPGFRRQGLAEAAMRQMLEVFERDHGLGQSVLQATPGGLRLYEEMGYRTVTMVRVFASNQD